MKINKSSTKMHMSSVWTPSLRCFFQEMIQAKNRIFYSAATVLETNLTEDLRDHRMSCFLF